MSSSSTRLSGSPENSGSEIPIPSLEPEKLQLIILPNLHVSQIDTERHKTQEHKHSGASSDFSLEQTTCLNFTASVVLRVVARHNWGARPQGAVELYIFGGTPHPVTLKTWSQAEGVEDKDEICTT